MHIILASQSPRRQELMDQAGIPCTCCPADVDETITCCTPPDAAVITLAARKAQAVFDRYPDAVVIGADTVVALGKQLFGKPANPEEAADMLRTLSGRTHQVYTGVCIIGPDGCFTTFFEKTDVTFFSLSDAEINAYIATGEPMDKAGAYGIQGRGALLVKAICGDYYNVVGLPIAQLVRSLKTVL